MMSNHHLHGTLLLSESPKKSIKERHPRSKTQRECNLIQQFYSCILYYLYYIIQVVGIGYGSDTTIYSGAVSIYRGMKKVRSLLWYMFNTYKFLCLKSSF